MPEEHPELYAFVYGGKMKASSPSGVRYVSERSIDRSETVRDSSDDDEKKSKKSKKSKDDDDDEGDKKDDDDDDDDDKGDKGDKKERKDDERERAKGSAKLTRDKSEHAGEEAHESHVARAVDPTPAPVAKATDAALSANGSYIPMEKALARAVAEGGSGAILKVDLEYDMVQSITTWDFTFASGTEYEIDAMTGNLVAAKQKAPAKLAVLEPIGIEKGSSEFMSFLEIIAAAEQASGSSVTEMELKKIKGRADTVFEVVMSDGATIYFDARSGEKAAL